MANETTDPAATHLPPLGAHVREDVGGELQATLVELIDLSLLGKQLHWTLVGPLFQPLHERLDTMVEAWRELSDTVAERAVAIGYVPDGQSEAVAGGSELARVDRAPIADRVAVRELAARLADVAERVRTRMDRLGELDAASQDVLIEVLRALEQQLWMTRVQLEGA
jgi:starvation-inducible DNA-binding protein